MKTTTIRRWGALAALTLLALLTVAATDAPASSGPTGCHGLSPASAVNCPADVFAP
jgi:hypothetical protein